MHFKTLSLFLLASFSIPQEIFASATQEELSFEKPLHSMPYATQIYSHEYEHLILEQQKIKKKYAPNNISRTTFNGFKKSDIDTVTIGDNTYHIAGLRSASPEEGTEIRGKFTSSLPHDHAIMSNTIKGLNVRSVSIDADFYVQVQYSYTPGPLDFSGIEEYFFTVETPLNDADKSFYKKFTHQITELTKYQDFDSQDHTAGFHAQPLWDETREPDSHYEKLQAQATLTLKGITATYEELRKARLDLLSHYDLLEENNKKLVRHFSFQTLQYRQYLRKAAETLDQTKDESKFEEYLKQLQSNSKRFSEPLLEFPKWFKTKDTQEKIYTSVYSKWK